MAFYNKFMVFPLGIELVGGLYCFSRGFESLHLTGRWRIFLAVLPKEKRSLPKK
jgi:hypothetical protein